jgi:hypothetical protein
MIAGSVYHTGPALREIGVRILLAGAAVMNFCR